MSPIEDRKRFMRSEVEAFLENSVHHYRNPNAQQQLPTILYYLKELGFSKESQRLIKSLARFSDVSVATWNKHQQEAISKANRLLILMRQQR